MFDKDTLAIIGDGECGYESAVSPPIFQTSTFGGGGEYSYTRLSNPTRSQLERELASLEQGRYALAFSSGLAALNALLSTLSQGDRVLLSDDLYGGTYRMAANIFSRFGISFEFVDPSDPSAVENAIDGDTRMLFVESPTNPMMKIAPIIELARICRERSVLLAVDNTFLTPYFQTPLLLGADIVLHSATKFLSGHHDTVAGALVTDNEPLYEKLRLSTVTLGNALSPFDSWLTLRGIRTLPLRMERHQRNALSVAEYLKGCDWVEKVIYPGLPEHEGHSLCASQASGFGGVVSFTVKDTKTVKKLLSGGEIIKFAESLGGFRSLITYPITQTHASIPESMRNRIGITEKLLRLSLGLEDENDIKQDIDRMMLS